jgi:hypothetical protein
MVCTDLSQYILALGANMYNPDEEIVVMTSYLMLRGRKLAAESREELEYAMSRILEDPRSVTPHVLEIVYCLKDCSYLRHAPGL